MDFQRGGFVLEVVAGDLGDLGFGRSRFRRTLRALFDQLPALLVFTDVVVIHSFTSDVNDVTVKGLTLSGSESLKELSPTQ